MLLMLTGFFPPVLLALPFLCTCPSCDDEEHFKFPIVSTVRISRSYVLERAPMEVALVPAVDFKAGAGILAGGTDLGFAKVP